MGMTSNSDDLEEQLRENLKLRRELQAEVGKAAAGGDAMATTLIVLGKIWIWVAAALIIFGYASIWWFEGFSKLQEILSPFNIWNYIAVVITVAPGFGLLKLGEWMRDRRAR